MRKLGLLSVVPLVLVFVASALGACDDSTSASPATVPEAGLPDRAAPTADSGAVDTGTPPPSDSGLDSASDAAGDAAKPCPIASNATVAATIKMSVDDNFKLYVNGVLALDFGGFWFNPQTVNITLNRNPQAKNVIAIEGINAQNATGLDRMIVAELSYMIDATVHTVITDASWKQSMVSTAGWEALGFAETGWLAAIEEGTHGGPPYNNVLGTSNAKYLWSYDSAAGDQAAKPASETVYFRKTFYVSQAGAPVASPGACN